MDFECYLINLTLQKVQGTVLTPEWNDWEKSECGDPLSMTGVRETDHGVLGKTA
jgi:hypothetical protein